MAKTQQNAKDDGNTVGLIGFIFSIVSIVLFWIPFFGAALAVTGIVLSAVGLGKQKSNRGLVIAGLVVGIVAFILSVIVLLGMFLFFAGITSAAHSMNYTLNYSNMNFSGYF